jgi:tetratricopeptide (TPR) repeat protein
MKEGRKAFGIGISSIWVAGLLLALLPGTAAFARQKPPRDQAQAMQWMQDALKALGTCPNAQIDSQYIVCRGSFGIALARVVSIGSNFDTAGGYPHFYVIWKDYSHDQTESVAWSQAILSFSKAAPRHQERFEAALIYMVANARQQAAINEQQSFAHFLAQAKAWREAAIKPAMPEEAHDHEVLAEFAFKQRDTEKAINEYTSALSVFPTWPEGQFNLATLAGEKKLYDVAILHMKEYLELVPESPDAQAAKDSVIVWRDQLKTALANSNIQSDAGESTAQAKGSLFQQMQAKQK